MHRLISTSFFILALALLGGCATLDTARDVVKQKGAQAADTALLDAEWLVCKATSIGAVKRRYGQTMETAETYRRFCDGDGQANVVSPE